LPAIPTELPPTDFSFVYETGEREIDDKGIPDTSTWAGEKRLWPPAQRPPRSSTPKRATSTTARVKIRRIRPGDSCLVGQGAGVHVLRLQSGPDSSPMSFASKKGHTEGLEPKITEELVKLMLSARGGKIQKGG